MIWVKKFPTGKNMPIAKRITRYCTFCGWRTLVMPNNILRCSGCFNEYQDIVRKPEPIIQGVNGQTKFNVECEPDYSNFVTELQECEKEMTNRSIADFKHESDSVSLAKLESKKFTIVAVEDSNYEDGGKVNEGVKIVTKESFDIDGKEWNKFHSTRTAIVNKLREKSIREALAEGDTIGPVKAVEVQAKRGGKNYFDLVPA